MPDTTAVADVADRFMVLMRSFSRARARMLAAAAHDVEWSANVVLKIVQTGGPMRATEIADAMHSDLSTISRQVAGLVKDGHLERRADPHDGRASLLVVTQRGEAVLADHDRIRLEYFARMLEGWDDSDLRDFADLLTRFTADYESADTTWIARRLARQPEPAGSSTA